MTSSKQRDATGLEIAIVGMAGRYPGAADLAELWANLCNGVEPIKRFSDEELAMIGLDASVLANPGLIREGFVLGDVDLFDAAFFGYSPREAEMIDPQQRIFLECAWEALEAAGCDPHRFPGPIGVFAGSSNSGYLTDNLIHDAEIVRQVSSLQLTLANDKDYLATRVAYKLNLRGPAVSVQTACSTSLVAVHLASQSLLAGDCDVALAGGVSIRAQQKCAYFYQEGGIASRDGHCRPFDADGSGTAASSGVGVVVLKRLADALASGDRIQAVILGSAMNNDGSGKIGFTAPSVEGQARVIEAAQRMAEVEPDGISYVEAHGTGTQLGDPIEVRALTRVFRTRTQRRQFCGIGSIKSNFGHTDAAAGVTGLIKAVLALENRALPPSLNFERPNREIDFESSPFYVNSTLKEWTREDMPRRAGVSSFGLGGTNVHVVLEEAPAPPVSLPERSWQLLTLSARTETALDDATRNLTRYLETHPQSNLADVAYTLHVGRTSFRRRRTVACRDVEDAIVALRPPDPKRVWNAIQEFEGREVVFMFPGQGAQHVDMARGLYESEPFFREIVDKCCSDLVIDLGLDLRAVMYPDADKAKDEANRLRHTTLAQPALFIVEYAMARLWMSWGVVPAACIGHSIGEYVAACICGVLSREHALHLVAARGRLMGQTASGAMLAIPMSEDEIRPMLGNGLDLASLNAPRLCVVSGSSAAVGRLQADLVERAMECQRLHTSHAFHSHLMDPVVDRFASLVASVPLTKPDRPFVSNVTGNWIDAASATDASYWGRHLREPVRFADGLAAVLENPDRVLLEVGPGRTLSSLVRQHPRCGSQRTTVPSMRHPAEAREDRQCLLDALGRLWAAGVRIDWDAFHANESRRRVPLPTYPFERQRYWVDPPTNPRHFAEEAQAQPEQLSRQMDVADWFYVPSWRREAPISAVVEPQRVDHMPAPTLVLAGEDRLSQRLIEALSANGQVVTAHLSEKFRDDGDRRFDIAPGEREHYVRMMRVLAERDLSPSRVISLWGASPPQAHAPEDEIDRCFFAPLFLMQAMATGDADVTARLELVTAGVFGVTGEEDLTPERATVLGPARVIPAEYPNVSCRCIDLAPSMLAGDDDARLVEALLNEMVHAPQTPLVAYRGRHRWTPTLQRTRLEAPRDHDPRLRERGCYLITGGMGGIGLILARYLARTVRARLVLVGRTALPPAAQWDEWLAVHGKADPVSRRINAARELEQLGAEVLVAEADVTDAAAMADVIRSAVSRFARIDGVVHAAGVAGGGIVQLKTREIAGAVLAPKIQGTRILETALAGQKPDFVLLCSSLTALFPVAGQSDYAAANAFLDAYAQACMRSGHRYTVSVNWDTWGEVGMAVETRVPGLAAAYRREQLAAGIRSDEGVDAFRRVLAYRGSQVAVSTFPLQERPAFAVSARDTVGDVESTGPELGAAKGQRSEVVGSSTYERPDLDEDYVAPRNETEAQIAAIWSQLLGIERVGVHDNFLDLGGHSLLATRLLARLKGELNVALTLEDIFVKPTVASIARRVLASGEALTPARDVERDQKVRTDDDLEPSGAGSPSGLLANVYATSKRKSVTR